MDNLEKVEKLRERANVSYQEAKAALSTYPQENCWRGWDIWGRKYVLTGLLHFFRICRDNSFCINHRDNNMIRLPLLAAVVILLFTWKITIPVMLIALLFGFRYSFEGKDELKQANAFMESASNAAESLREGFTSSGKAASENAASESTASESTASENSGSSSENDTQ